jgi:hypothetical protein
MFNLRSESSSTSPLQMTLLENRVGGGGGGTGDGSEVTTLTARYHSSTNRSNNVKQKMMDTSTSHEESSASPYLLHLSHPHQQQQQQQQQQLRNVANGNAFVEGRTRSSPQRVPDVGRAVSGIETIGDRIERRHELKDWSEVSTVLLQSPTEDLKDQRHNLANNDAYNDRNNNTPSGNQMNF